MTIYVIDDHPLMRDAIAMVLRRLRPDMNIVEFGRLADLQPSIEDDVRAGVIFLDLNLPDAQGCSGVQLVKQRYPDAPLAVYSALPASDVEAECLDAGADLYIEKTANSQALATALRRLLRKSSVLPLTASGRATVALVPAWVTMDTEQQTRDGTAGLSR